MEHFQGSQKPDKAQWEQGLREAGSRWGTFLPELRNTGTAGGGIPFVGQVHPDREVTASPENLFNSGCLHRLQGKADRRHLP